MLFQFPDSREAVHRIPGKTADRFCNNQVNFPVKGVSDHCLKTLTFFRIRCADAFIRVYGHKFPIAMALDIIRIICDLRLIAGGLILMVG